MTIQVGDKMPEGAFGVMTAEGPGQVTSEELFAGKKTVIFAVPGAFTPACSAKHLPGFIEKSDELKAKGVDNIACLSVNDVFVMGAWSKDQGAEGKVTLLADGNADYVTALGLQLDATGFGMGTRGERFAVVVEDGVVTQLHREAAASDVKASSAENILNNL
ncbi:MAG: peroxiredoxin [Thiotrichales bacterium]|nr:peroxiredoxin [Thiotrichales bacterium]OUX50041.1 MAG: peroxiredoxin [Methylococcaceae bacterium TMED282]